MAGVFDGASYAKKLEVPMRIRMHALGLKPKMASIIVGENPASHLYVNLKKKAAERIGAEVEIYKIQFNKDHHYLINLIKMLNGDSGVNGIMIQLPLTRKLAPFEKKIIDAIAPEKDVDGLREDSPFAHPTAMAVELAINAGKKYTRIRTNAFVTVIGHEGRFGSIIYKHLQKIGRHVEGPNKNTRTKEQFLKYLEKKRFQTKIVVTALNIGNYIGADQVRKNAVVIDIGSPRGNLKFEEVAGKAAFVTPVPGGVGPVTVICLLENLITAAYNQSKHISGAISS